MVRVACWLFCQESHAPRNTSHATRNAMQTFVGFGFGPIQAGLFLAEAFRSGNFGRLVVAEVLPEVVAAVRQAGSFTVNIGHSDRIEALTVGPLEIYQPQVAADRDALVAAVAAADALATAVPSVSHYAMGGDASIAAILADGLRAKAAAGGPLAVVYAAENHTDGCRVVGGCRIGSDSSRRAGVGTAAGAIFGHDNRQDERCP